MYAERNIQLMRRPSPFFSWFEDKSPPMPLGEGRRREAIIVYADVEVQGVEKVRTRRHYCTGDAIL